MADFCRNHPTVEASAACARCAQPFCDACLVDFMGQRLCGPCHNLRVREMQGQIPGQVAGEARLAGTGTVDLGRWLSEGWQIVSSDLVAFGLAALLAGLVTVCTCGILAGPMACGLFMMCYRKMLYGRVDASNVFDGFRRAGPAILGGLMILLISVAVQGIIQMPLGIVQLISRREAVTSAASAMNLLVGTLVSGLIMGATFFVLPHIAARNVDPIAALVASWSVFRRNPMMYIVTAWVISIISYMGGLLCCIGALVVGPWMVALQARAYADHFGIGGFDET